MKKKKVIITLFILSAIVGFIINKYRTNHAGFQPEVPLVQAIVVHENNFPIETSAIGTLVARNVEITPEIAGHVQAVLFKDGSIVKQGTPLIQLDNAIYKAKYDSAKAQLLYSENNYNRMTLLGKQGAIAKQAIDQASAELKEKKASAKESEVLYTKMLLTAPFDGVIGKSKVNSGDYVTMGQSVVTLTDTDHLRVEYYVPEKFLPLLKLNQEVKITTTAYPDKTFLAKVAFISPTINAENRSLLLYAEIDNTENKLAPGMFVNILQSLGKNEKVIVVPARSLIPIFDGQQIFKVVDNKAYETNVVIGKRIDDRVQILQGLKPGDVIITDGQSKVKNGTPIKIKT